MKKIDVKTLKQKMEQQEGSLTLFDARGDTAYAEEHLPFAKSAPTSALRERVDGLIDKESEIIVYCTNPECTASEKAGEQLEEMGFENVVRFAGGIEAWKEAGHDTVTA